MTISTTTAMKQKQLQKSTGGHYVYPKECTLHELPNLIIPLGYFTIGFLSAFNTTPQNIYLVEVLNAEPAKQNLLNILVTLPWSLKIGFGFLSDAVPIGGLHRKPYLTIGSFITALAYLVYWYESKNGNHSYKLLALCVFVGACGQIMVDVMCDTMCVQRSKFEPIDSKGQMQATCYSCRFAGALIGATLGMVVASSSRTSVFDLHTWTFELTFAQVCLVNGLIPFFTLFPFLYFLRENYPRPRRDDAERAVNGWDALDTALGEMGAVDDVHGKSDDKDKSLGYGTVSESAGAAGGNASVPTHVSIGREPRAGAGAGAGAGRSNRSDNANAEGNAAGNATLNSGSDQQAELFETKTINEAQHYVYNYTFTEKQRSIAYGEVLWEAGGAASAGTGAMGEAALHNADATGGGAGAGAGAGAELESPSSFHYGASPVLPTLDITVSVPSPKKNKTARGGRDSYGDIDYDEEDSGNGIGGNIGSSYGSYGRDSPVANENTPLFASTDNNNISSSGNKAVYSTHERNSRLSELNNIGDGHMVYYDGRDDSGLVDRSSKITSGAGGGSADINDRGDNGKNYRRTIGKQLDDIWNTIQLQSVWLPMTFIYIYNVMQIPNVAWQSFLQLTLKFSPHFLGLSVCLGSLMTFVGVLTYKYYYFDATWRSIYIYSTLLCAFFSMLQILLIFGINRSVFGIGNYWFSMGDDVISAYIAGIQFLPVCIMYMGLCPAGSEGASYAILTTMGNIALNIANTLGNSLSGIWDVSNEALERGDMSGLWRLTTLTSFLSILPLLLIGLLPKNAAEQANLGLTQKRSRLGGQIFLTILVASLCWVFITSMYSILSAPETPIIPPAAPVPVIIKKHS